MKSPSQHHTAPARLASKPGKHLLEHNIVNQDLLLVQNDREAKLLVQTKYLFILSPPPTHRGQRQEYISLEGDSHYRKSSSQGLSASQEKTGRISPILISARKL